MATFFKNVVIKDVGITPVRILETLENTRATVIGMSLCNLTTGSLLVSVQIQDDTSAMGYYIKNVVLAANTSLRAINGGEKLILAPSNALFVNSNVENSLDIVLSYVEIV